MTREEKGELIESLTEKLKNTTYFYLTDTSGLKVSQINNFRRMCFEKGIEYKVVKNTIIRKALENLETDYTPFNDTLKGSTGIMFSGEIANAAAKVIKDFRKKGGRDFAKPGFKAASIDSGLFIGEENLNILSDLKSKDELLGEIVGLLQSPAKNVISALSSGKHILAGLVKTLSEKEN